MDEGRTSGVGKIEDNMGEVELSATGAGEVVYNLADTAYTLDDERVELPVTFVRESEDDLPAIGRGRVTVSFHPVSGVGGDTFEVGAAPLPRFVKAPKPPRSLRLTLAPRRCCSPTCSTRAASIPE